MEITKEYIYNDIIITKHTKSNESMLPSSCFLKILQYVKMKARKNK